MKKLNLGNISAGLDTLKGLQEQNASVARNEQIKAELIDLAEKNSYAADDTEESIRDLADQIEELGLLNPLGVVEHHGRYTLFSGERRYKAITQHLHWETIPCRVFEGVSAGRAQLMLHIANGARDYSPARKLALYEEYHQLLEELKANGEFKGGIQKGIAELLNVSDRQVRTYRTISEALTASEKQAVQNGGMSFGEAQSIAASRTAISNAKTGKSGSTSAFTPEPPPAAQQEKPMAEYHSATGKEVKSGTTSGFALKSMGAPDNTYDSNRLATTSSETKKSGSTSAFSLPSTEIPDLKPDKLNRTLLLVNTIFSNQIWVYSELRSYYIKHIPTFQEAYKDILAPKSSNSNGPLNLIGFNGSYTCDSNQLSIHPQKGSSITYAYSEVDAMIRKLYREKKLN